MLIFSIFIPKRFISVVVALLLCVTVSIAFGAELNVPVVSGSQGDIVKLPVIIDKVDNLAGIKLSLSYDKNTLKFIKAEKTTYTANMLHVVNDKVPGRLIIVMAAARGFTGENAPLVEMSFELLKDVKKEDNVIVQIIEAELMNDKLQRIKTGP
jgi:hypothetical protein